MENTIPRGFNLKSHVQSQEKWYIKTALDNTSGNKTKAAVILGMNRTTLVEKLRKYYPSRLNIKK